MPDHFLPTRSAERIVLASLMLVQFTHIMDFMIMMPLGPHFMRVFGIGPDKFGLLVSSYGVSAAITGFTASFFLDRIDRKRALLWLYGGFGLATLGCALSPSYTWLLLARIMAGGFGGVSGSVVAAIVGDVIPPERRGRGMGFVMSAFPMASVLGVPVGIFLANRFEWHAPFFVIAGVSIPVLLLAWRNLPSLPPELTPGGPTGARQVWAVLTHRVHLRAFAVTSSLVFMGSTIIPFMAPSMVTNVGLSEEQLPFIYLCGGVATLFTMQLFGRMSDRYDKLHVLFWTTLAGIVAVMIITRLPPVPMIVALSVTTLFMVTMSGRFAPAMAMITNRVEARYRGSFMSINSSIQQMAGGLGTLIAGLVVTKDAAGHLVGYANAGWLSLAASVICLICAWYLRAAAPELTTKARPETTAAAARTAEAAEAM